MAAPVKNMEPGIGYISPRSCRMRHRNHPVLFAPNDEGRHTDPLSSLSNLIENDGLDPAPIHAGTEDAAVGVEAPGSFAMSTNTRTKSSLTMPGS